MYARRARHARVALRTPRAAPSLRTERRPNRRREKRTKTGDGTREEEEERTTAARHVPAERGGENHPRCTRTARVAHHSARCRFLASASVLLVVVVVRRCGWVGGVFSRCHSPRPFSRGRGLVGALNFRPPAFTSGTGTLRPRPVRATCSLVRDAAFRSLSSRFRFAADLSDWPRFGGASAAFASLAAAYLYALCRCPPRFSPKTIPSCGLGVEIVRGLSVTIDHSGPAGKVVVITRNIKDGGLFVTFGLM